MGYLDKYIKKIIQEESEMKEMGVKLSRLSKIQPKNYLIQSSKELEKKKKKIERHESYQNMFLQATQEIQSLNWQDLRIRTEHYGSSETIYFSFPRSIDSKLRQSFKLENLEYESHRLDKRFQNFIDHSDKGGYEIYIELEEYRNRTHFPEGLPDWLKGLGLGVKLYRKVLNKFGFIQSSESASLEVQKLYSDLVQRTDVNCALTKHETLLMDSGLNKDKKIKILGEFVVELYQERFFNRRIELNRDIVIDSNLLRELGPKKVSLFLEELFKLKKNYWSKDAFHPETFGKFSD